jgi:hypothetical protein
MRLDSAITSAGGMEARGYSKHARQVAALYHRQLAAHIARQCLLRRAPTRDWVG